MGERLLERHGRAKVAQIVASFYNDVLGSPRLARYFHNVSIPGLVEHQAMFLATTMGAPSLFSADDIRYAHAHLEIGGEDFEEMLRLLEDALLRHGFTRAECDEVLSAYRSFQDQVVNERAS